MYTQRIAALGQKAITILLLTMCLCAVSSPVIAAEDTSPKVIRVGWFDYKGFYMKDKNGYRSGYAYDYLQELARHGGWRYEYIEATVPECMRMLEDGRIDVLGPIMYAPERDNIMSFTTYSIGQNFSLLTVRADDQRYQLNQYQAFNGMVIGVLSGDYRKNWLAEYAQAHGFTYSVVYYTTPDQMNVALQQKEVDAILMTNMRITDSRERIIAQFAPVNFYFTVKKGNYSILQPLNTALEKMEFYHKGFRSELAQKYFSTSFNSTITFTEEEAAFIRDNPVLRVSLPLLHKPIVYIEDDTPKGIIVDILDEISRRIGIRFEYIPVSNQPEGIKAVISGQSSLLSHTYTNYSWGEQNALYLTHPFMKLDYMQVSRIGEDLNRPDLRVAAVRGFYFSLDYVLSHYNEDQITWYDNEKQCIDAIANGTQDVCYANNYVANDYLQSSQGRGLYAYLINYSHELSTGLPIEGSYTLLSILDKAIISLDQVTISNIIISHTSLNVNAQSLSELIMRYPTIFIGIFSVFITIIAALIIMQLISRINRKKNLEIYRAKLAAERDSLTGLYNRLSVELLVNDALQRQPAPTHGAFIMLDVDNFKKINDSLGHRHGDKVLVTLAMGLTAIFKENAIIGRMGGDEFAIFVYEPSDFETFSKQLQEAQRRLNDGEFDNIAIACSMGAVLMPYGTATFPALYEAADESLYIAKYQGKGCVHVAMPDR